MLFCFVWLALFGLVVIVCSGWNCLVLLGLVSIVLFGMHCFVTLHHFVWLALIGFVWLAFFRYSLVWLNDSEPRNPRGVCFTQVL